MIRPLDEAPARAGVYLLYEHGRVIYVGQSTNVSRRTKGARRGDCVAVIPQGDPRRRRAMELALIRAFNPPGNVAGTPKRRPAFEVYVPRPGFRQVNITLPVGLVAEIDRLAGTLKPPMSRSGFLSFVLERVLAGGARSVYEALVERERNKRIVYEDGAA